MTNLNAKIAQSIIDELHDLHGSYADSEQRRSEAHTYALLAIAEELQTIAGALVVLTEHQVNR